MIAFYMPDPCGPIRALLERLAGWDGTRNQARRFYWLEKPEEEVDSERA